MLSMRLLQVGLIRSVIAVVRIQSPVPQAMNSGVILAMDRIPLLSASPRRTTNDFQRKTHRSNIPHSRVHTRNGVWAFVGVAAWLTDD